MKKQTVVVLWSIVILALIGGCCGFYIYKGLKENNESRGQEVFACLPADIVRYSVSGGGAEDSFTLERSADGWMFSEGGAAVIADAKAESLINAASRITALKKIPKSELKLYKTAAGTAEKIFELELKNGKNFRTEFLGSYKGNSAFRVSDDDSIYIMNTSVRDILTPTKEQLSVIKVFDGGKVERIRYEEQGDVLEIVRETAEDGRENYQMTEPYRGNMTAEKAEQFFEVDIPNIKIVKFIENPSEDMANYGLDEKTRAMLTVTMSVPNKESRNADSVQREETLYLGTNNGGLVYAMKAEDKSVFAVNSVQPEILRAELETVLEEEKTETHNSEK